MDSGVLGAGAFGVAIGLAYQFLPVINEVPADFPAASPRLCRRCRRSATWRDCGAPRVAPSAK
ncbi:hypothetical protein ACFV23_10300, partial [Streptomyces sp. NPDC059627]